ncbi:hypothetical protein DFH09DRAFT_1093143 [Mycena vulgaris]|nr:hypothetical protein DFH09DRAFT_1093143 [Mycena vulgaris]
MSAKWRKKEFPNEIWAQTMQRAEDGTSSRSRRLTRTCPPSAGNMSIGSGANNPGERDETEVNFEAVMLVPQKRTSGIVGSAYKHLRRQRTSMKQDQDGGE